MATIVNNNDGTLTVTLSAIEQQTVMGLVDDSLAQYVTLWLEEKAKQIFNEKFKQLTAEEQASVLQMLQGV